MTVGNLNWTRCLINILAVKAVQVKINVFGIKKVPVVIAINRMWVSCR